MHPFLEKAITADSECARLMERFLGDRPDFDLVHVMHSMRLLDALEIISKRSIPYVMTLTDFFSICYRINLIDAGGMLCEGSTGGKRCASTCPLESINAEFIVRHDRFRELLGSASARVAVSQFVARHFRNEWSDLEFLVVEHGIDLSKFGPRSSPPHDQLVFGFVGTIGRAKGILPLIEAFRESGVSNSRLEIIGPCFEPDYLERVKAAADGCPAITFHDSLPSESVPARLEKLDVLCIPSLVPESYSLVQQEAFAAGVPCLVSSLGNPPIVTEENHCGMVLQAGNVADWARGIRHAVENPSLLEDWCRRLPLPRRQEEEAFSYSVIYRDALEREGASTKSN
jgi:glycosyltransferase involved in cell wall biosynthesis